MKFDPHVLVSFIFAAVTVSASKLSIKKLENAVDDGNIDLAKKALSEGIRADARLNDTGLTAIMLAAELGKVEIFNFLLEKGASLSKVDKFNYNALHFASTHAGSINGLKECLKHTDKFDINAPESEQNNTALHFAAVSGSFEKVKALVEAGASINQKNSIGNTPLLAAMHGTCQSLIHIAYLVKKGADYLEVNDYGMDCLALASDKNHIDVAKLLLNKIKPTKSILDTVIIRALYFAKTEEMKILINQYIPIPVSFSCIERTE